MAILDLVLIELQFDHGFFAPLCSYAAAFAFALGFAFGLGFASRLAEAILSYTHPHVLRNDERIVRMLQAESETCDIESTERQVSGSVPL